MKKKSKQNINLHVPITMTSYSWKGDIFLPPNTIYVLHIDYPLQKPAKFNIKAGKNGMGAIALINKIGKLYEHIYNVDEEENKADDEYTYYVFGHGIEDLSLSGIHVDHLKKRITLSVDS